MVTFFFLILPIVLYNFRPRVKGFQHSEASSSHVASSPRVASSDIPEELLSQEGDNQGRPPHCWCIFTGVYSSEETETVHCKVSVGNFDLYAFKCPRHRELTSCSYAGKLVSRATGAF
jgi:hypothetical protein